MTTNHQEARMSIVKLTLGQIIEMVALEAECTVDDLKSPIRIRDIAWPRQEAMYVLRHARNLSHPRIGYLFGKRDHTTSMHAIKRVSERMEICGTTRDRVRRFMAASNAPEFISKAQRDGVFVSRRGIK